MTLSKLAYLTLLPAGGTWPPVAIYLQAIGAAWRGVNL
jgi:hypothetical protein